MSKIKTGVVIKNIATGKYYNPHEKPLWVDDIQDAHVYPDDVGNLADYHRDEEMVPVTVTIKEKR